MGIFMFGDNDAVVGAINGGIATQLKYRSITYALQSVASQLAQRPDTKLTHGTIGWWMPRDLNRYADALADQAATADNIDNFKTSDLSYVDWSFITEIII